MSRKAFLEKSLTTKLFADTVAVDISVQYTTYDSPRAWCNDGYVELISGIVLDNDEQRQLAVDAIKAYFTEEGFNYSDIDLVEDKDDYAYGYTVVYRQYSREAIETRIANLEEEQVRLQEEIARLSAI